jgi:hypothetical protein
MPQLGRKHSPATREAIGRASRRMWARKRAEDQVSLADVIFVERNGTGALSARAFLPATREVYVDLIEDQGGEDIAAARKTLTGAHSRLLLAEYLCGVRIAQDPTDLEAMARLTAIVNSRRALLVALGLERKARDLEAEVLSPERLRAARQAAGLEPQTPGDSGVGSAAQNAPGSKLNGQRVQELQS